MINKHKTTVVFWTSLVFAALSILIVILHDKQYLPLLVLSIGMNVWAISKSEQTGFIKTTQARRAYEPPRHFNVFQVLLLLFATIAQIGVGVVVLVV